MRFFFDRCLGITVPRRLRELGYPVEIYQEWFEDPNLPDDEWLAFVGQRGWIVVTKDGKLHYREPEVFAWRQYGIGAFYIWNKHFSVEEKVAQFVALYDRMVRLAKTTPRPFAFRVHADGTFQRLGSRFNSPQSQLKKAQQQT